MNAIKHIKEYLYSYYECHQPKTIRKLHYKHKDYDLFWHRYYERARRKVKKMVKVYGLYIVWLALLERSTELEIEGQNNKDPKLESYYYRLVTFFTNEAIYMRIKLEEKNLV